MKLTAIVLTWNEEMHIERCLNSLQGVADDVYVVDCFSTDQTVEIAERCGATVLQNKWLNHAAQFNWGLENLVGKHDWILRIDADEYLTPDLKAEIKQKIPDLGLQVSGVYCNRMIKFQGELIRHGGIFPVPVLRIFRYGKGKCENRWMDEHIKVVGETVGFKSGIIDDNLNTLSWWIDKHNKYANLEAFELLNIEYQFQPVDTVATLRGERTGLKRWIKEKIYVRLPGGFRAFLYFFYRYFIRLGFLDGKTGLTFHFLQAFWYRFLVDAKVLEVKRYIKNNDVSVLQATKTVLGVSL